MLFCSNFGSILDYVGSISVLFLLHLPPLRGPGDCVAKCPRMDRFWVPPRLPFGRHFRPKTIKKTINILLIFLTDFFIDFEIQNASQNPPKNPPEMNQQICPKIHTICYRCFIDLPMIFKDICKYFRMNVLM